MHDVVHRAAFRPLFLALVAVPLPILVLTAYIAFGRRISAVVAQAISVGLGPKLALLGVLFVGLLLAVVAFSTLTLSQRLVVHLRPTGLAARSVLGRLVFISWDEVRTVRLVRLPFVTFARVCADGKPPILVPLFVTDPRALNEAINHLTPEGHPLRQALGG